VAVKGVRPEGPLARREDYEVARCDFGPAAALVRRLHYTCSTANTGRAYCLVRRADGEVAGVALYMPAPLGAAKSAARDFLNEPDAWRTVLSLSRVVVVPGEPKNVGTILLAGAERDLRKLGRYRLLLSYADEAEGHEGTLYKAANWTEAGYTKPTPRWENPATGCRVSLLRDGRTRTRAEMLALGYRELPPSRKRIFYRRIV
jgi:hypothetical protein